MKKGIKKYIERYIFIIVFAVTILTIVIISCHTGKAERPWSMKVVAILAFVTLAECLRQFLDQVIEDTEKREKVRRIVLAILILLLAICILLFVFNTH